MTGLGEGTAQAEADLADGLSSTTSGVCTAIDWPNGLASVNIAGGVVKMPMVGQAPFVGFRVLVGYLGKQPLCLGMVARAVAGTVSVTATGGYVGVLGDDGVTYSLPYIGTAPTSGQRVAIDWGNGGRVLGVSSAEAVVPGSVAAPSSAGAQPRQFEFRPTDSKNWYNGSAYNNGASGSEAWCSSSNRGVYVYGDVIPDSIPDSAVFVPGSLSVHLAEFYNQFPSSLAQLGYHNLSSLSGDPVPAGLFSIPDARGGLDIALPDAWESLFRLGSARGIAFNNGPGYHKYRPAGVENSGVIVGTWKV